MAVLVIAVLSSVIEKASFDLKSQIYAGAIASESIYVEKIKSSKQLRIRVAVMIMQHR